MSGKRLFSVLAIGVFLFLPFADCVPAADASKQAMQCCRSMPCTPANKSHNCCKTMISARTPNMLPVARVSLAMPAVAVIAYARMLGIPRFTPVARMVIQTQQHSPPALYTLNVTLLI